MHFCQTTRSITKFRTLTIYNSQSKFLIINNFTFPARLYPQERIDELLEILSQRHGIQTSKI